MVWILVFLMYWLVLFVGCYVVVEFGQTYYYEEKTPGAALKVAGATLILALLYTRYSWLQNPPATHVGTWHDQIFTTTAAWLVVVSILAFVLFTLVLQFYPQHAVFLGPLTVLIVGGMAFMAADNISGGGGGGARTEIRLPSKPQRKAIGGVPPAAPAEAQPPGPSVTPAKAKR